MLDQYGKPIQLTGPRGLIGPAIPTHQSLSSLALLNEQQKDYLRQRPSQQAYGQAAMNQHRPSKPEQPAMRTKEQIIAQLEARYAELEREAASPRITMPCVKCRWVKDECWCTHALVIGFHRKTDFVGRMEEYVPSLCGPEKALWEPRLTFWQRFKAWFLAPWTEEAGQ